MADNSGDLGSFLAGFVIGGLIGAGVALLTAPQSGEETRAMIGEKGIELRDRAEELASQTAETYEAQIKRLQAAVDAGKKPSKGEQPPAEEAASEA
ncbi:MAG: YtxH domain-containing protein [Anaerolineales bacterium]|jgi:gas vesicle protein